MEEYPELDDHHWLNFVFFMFKLNLYHISLVSAEPLPPKSARQDLALGHF